MFSLLPDVVVQFVDGLGKPLAGGLVYTYESSTTTLKPTFADPDGNTPNTNPIVLDAAGRAKIYLDTGAYRVRILSRDGVLITDTNQVSRFVNNVELAEVLKTVNDGLNDLANVEEALGSLVDEAFRSQKGFANGIAPLNGDGKIPAEYLQNIPDASTTDKGLVKLATESSTSAVEVITAKILDDLKKTMFGFGQTLKDVTNGRAVATKYKNTTGQPIFIDITIQYSTPSSSVLFKVNDVATTLIRDGDGEYAHYSTMIQDQAEYELTGGVIVFWREFRK